MRFLIWRKWELGFEQVDKHGTKSVNPNQDTEHLSILSIFHYVVAGFLALVSMFPLFHLAFGIAIISGALGNGGNGTPPPAFLGWFIVVIAACMIMFGLAMAASIALAGRRLAQSRNYMYCLVVAGVECMFMPFGTVLGVFTIIVLMRPSVKQLFGASKIA